MAARWRIVIMVAALSAVIIAPSALLSPFNAATAGSMIGLGGLGIAFVALATDLRVSLITAVAFAGLALLAAVGASHVIVGILALVAVAIGVGVTARWGWNRSFVMLPITLAFIASESVVGPPVDSTLVFAAAVLAYGIFVALIVTVLRSRLLPPHKNSVYSVQHSWAGTIGYAVMLVVTASITATIALLNGWGHTGGWLIMTPFIVIQPAMRDGMVKSVNRAVGTIAGFAIAYLAAEVLGSGPVLTAVGYAFAVLAVIAMVKHWHYALYAMVLTPAIVILESIGRSVQQTSDYRLVATLLGVGIALATMAVAMPIYRYRNRTTSAGNQVS